ncbi:TolC family protein [Niabella soli]|uniref:TolC family protein n=1 Tax=Niabella soli TaxID=446683 RepID=UPI000249988C|nr:TolC family protein [Niabella soli]
MNRYILLLFFTTGTLPVFAQRVSIDEALQLAQNGNLEFKVNDAEIKKSRAAVGTAAAVPNTGVFAENEDLQAGNSKGILKIGVSQSVAWPGVYKARRIYLKEQAKYYELNRAAIDAQLKKEVRMAYYQLWYLQNRSGLYQQMDSIYKSLLQAATLRYNKGEAAGIEKIAADVRFKELQAQQQEIINERILQQQQLMLLLNTQQSVLPLNSPLQKITLEAGDTVTAHPLLALQQQQLNIAASGIMVQKNENRPELSGRFFSQALYGIREPYSGFSVSVGIPLFNAGANRQKINVAKADLELQQKKGELQEQRISSQKKQAQTAIAQADAMVQYYESNGLKQAGEIIKAAVLGYKGGELSFMELTQYLNQATDMQKSYLDALNKYNQAVIQYLYFINL